MTVKIGCDPELFLSIGGKFVSACDLFPGTKQEPHRIDKGAVQVDGNALEFNIDPAETEEQFEQNIRTVLIQLEDMVHIVDKDMKLEFVPVADFDLDYWNTVPLSAKELGCDPDFNISGKQNPNPSELIFNTPKRTAAGHVHIGWDTGLDPANDSHFADCTYIAKRFHIAGVFKPETTKEHERLKYYGDNGAFRPKSYGVELRSPSNLWVANEKTRRNMFNLVRSNFKMAVGI